MSKRSPNLMQRAQQEAARFQHEYVATEHFLLALASMSGTAAAQALATEGIDYNSILNAVQQCVPFGFCEAPAHKLRATPLVKRALELAIRIARDMAHHTVEPEHVLLGLIGDGESGAVSVLLTLGVAPESLRQAVLKAAGWN